MKRDREVTELTYRFVCFDYLPEGFDVVGTVGSSGEIRQVELDLVPAFVKSHRHGADKGLDTRGRLIV